MENANSSVLRKKAFAGAAAAVLAVQGTHQLASAAVITFGAAQTISGVSDVSTAGSVLYAYAFGTATSETVNGVTFTGWNAATLTTSPTTPTDGSTNATISASQAANPGYFAVFGNGGTAGPIGTINTASPAYYNLLNSEEESANGGNACSITLTLQNLSPGTQYQFEMWVDDSRGQTPNTGRYDIVTSGGSGVTLQYNTTSTVNGVGEFVNGTFTADSSRVQAITIAGGSTTSAVLAPQIAGFDVESLVPEPASSASIVLALSALACLRRRRGA